MIITELQINDAAERQLHLIASRQIPFAVAASLTAVAKIAQAEVRDHINETFILRYLIPFEVRYLVQLVTQDSDFEKNFAIKK